MQATLIILSSLLSTLSLAASVHEPRAVPQQEAPKMTFGQPNPFNFDELLKGFDLEALKQRVPVDDLLQKSKEALKDSKFDFDLEGLAKKTAEQLKNLKKEKDFGLDLDSASDEEPFAGMSSEFAKLLGITPEEFQEQQRKTRELLQEAKSKDGKLDWSKLFSFDKKKRDSDDEALNYDEVFEL